MDVCPKTSKMKNFFEKIKSAEFFEKQKSRKNVFQFFQTFQNRIFFVLKMIKMDKRPKTSDKNGHLSNFIIPII